MSRIITSILVLSVFILFLIPFLKRLHIPSKMKKLRNNRMMKRNIKKIPDFTGKYFITVDQCFQTLYEMLIGAKHEIHYSCFALDMYTVLPYHNNRLPLYQIFNNLAKDGVKIHLLYNSTGEYSNQNPSELIKLLDPKINIYLFSTENKNNALLGSIVNQHGYSFNHMKFLVVDSTILFGGTDISYERINYDKINRDGYSWHDVGVQLECGRYFIEWLDKLYSLTDFCIKKIPYSPFPFINHDQETECWVRLIQNSKHILYIEHQFIAFNSQDIGGSRDIFDALVNRIVKSVRHRDNLKIIILTNLIQKDESCGFVSLFTKTNLFIHICDLVDQILRKLRTNNQDILLNTLYYGRLRFDHHNIKIHSNILISDDLDGKFHCIRSSSNGSERSFGNMPCDIELALYLKGMKVYEMLMDLLRQHSQKSIHSYLEFWNFIHTPQQLIIPIEYACHLQYFREIIANIMNLHPSSGHCEKKMELKKIVL